MNSLEPMKSRILYTRPSITDLETGYAADAARNGWGERCYEYIQRFEELFRNHLDVEYAIATSSCTGALHLGLAALDISAGDEVILADTNWIASVAPVVHIGATPVFVDIDPQSWCLDAAQVERAITSKTRAIIAVHLYGNLCDMDKLLALGAKYGIPVIEDAAEAIGSVYKGKRAGALGKFGTFSFHGTKTLTTGEGGMFVTNDAALYERVLTLNNHGRARGQTKQFWPDIVGYKYKISNLQAAIGCGQMERVEELVARKRAIMAYYRSRLSGLRGAKLNYEPPGCVIGAWMPSIVFDASTGLTREKLQAALVADNIDARVFFHPLSSLPMFTPQPQNRWAFDIPTRAINLPTYHDMTPEQLERVCDVIKALANG